jgi:hypothetical protein
MISGKFVTNRKFPFYQKLINIFFFFSEQRENPNNNKLLQSLLILCNKLCYGFFEFDRGFGGFERTILVRFSLQTFPANSKSNGFSE